MSREGDWDHIRDIIFYEMGDTKEDELVLALLKSPEDQCTFFYI